MVRLIGVNPGARALTANQTTVFTGADIPSAGLVALFLIFTGTNPGIAATGIKEVFVKDDNGVVFQANYKSLLALQRRLSKSNFAYTAGATRITIPLNAFELNSIEGLADAYQFPVGSGVTLEISCGGGTFTTANVKVGWAVQNDVKPKGTIAFIPQKMGIPVSQNDFPFQLTTQGKLHAFTFPSVGLNQLRLVQGNRDLFNCLGRGDTPDPDMIAETQQLQDGAYTTDHHCIVLDTPIDIIGGGVTKFLVNSGANWVTTVYDDTAGLYLLRDYTQPAPAAA